MKNYELTVLIHPDLEMNLTPATEKVEKIISATGGKITKEENEGKRHLAYPVKGQEFAVYYFYELELPADAPAKISGQFNIADEIIRFLLVKADPRRAKMEEKRKNNTNTEEQEDTKADKEV